MAISQTIDVSKEAQGAPGEIELRMRALQGARLHSQIGRGVAEVFKAHFTRLNSERANELGGKRTNFYSNAMKATNSKGTTEEAIVSVAAVGIRQRLEGGTIRPGAGKKYLTIPARAEAYNRRAGEFKDLQFVPLSGGRGMLVVKEPEEDYQFGDTPKFKKAPRENEEGMVYYWLVPSVVQKADRSVIPDDRTIEAAVRKTVNAAWNFKTANERQ